MKADLQDSSVRLEEVDLALVYASESVNIEVCLPEMSVIYQSLTKVMNYYRCLDRR